MFGKEIEIPEEWNTSFISAEFKLKTGGTPSRTHPKYFDGDIYWVTSTDLNRSSITSTLESISWNAKEITRLEIFQKGTFVIATYGLEAAGTRGKCGILNVNATINQACLAFIPTGKITTKFLFYFYLTYGEQIAFNYAQGTKQQNLYPDIVRKIPIIKPPIPEQQKIASILSGVDALIESTQNVIEKAERLKKGLMQKLLTRGIGHTKFKQVKWLFGKEMSIPQVWKWSELGKEGNLSSGSTPRRDHPEYYKGNIPWVSSGELDYNIIENTHETITSLAVEKTNLKIHPKDTFLFAITGLEAKGTRGRCAILGVSATTNQSCMAFNKPNSLLSKFLFYYFLLFGEKIIFSLAQGTKQQSLNLYLSKKIKIPIPEYEEQQKIASILSGVDAVRHHNIITSIILRIKFAIFLILCVWIGIVHTLVF